MLRFDAGCHAVLRFDAGCHAVPFEQHTGSDANNPAGVSVMLHAVGFAFGLQTAVFVMRLAECTSINAQTSKQAHLKPNSTSTIDLIDGCVQLCDM